MKIAICFSGQIRTFEKCWPTYAALLDKYDCDLFAATPPNEILKNYPFKEVLIHPDQIMPDHWYNLNNHPKSPGQPMLSQFFFIELANKVRLKYQEENNIQYDFVFRTRFDNKIIGELPDLENCDPSQIYIPSGNDNPECWPESGISDRFAFGGNHPLNIYSNKIQEIDEYMSNIENWYFAEIILKWVLTKYQIKINRFPNIIKVLRHNGDLV